MVILSYSINCWILWAPGWVGRASGQGCGLFPIKPLLLQHGKCREWKVLSAKDKLPAWWVVHPEQHDATGPSWVRHGICATCPVVVLSFHSRICIRIHVWNRLGLCHRSQRSENGITERAIGTEDSPLQPVAWSDLTEIRHTKEIEAIDSCYLLPKVFGLYTCYQSYFLPLAPSFFLPPGTFCYCNLCSKITQSFWSTLNVFWARPNFPLMCCVLWVKKDFYPFLVYPKLCWKYLCLKGKRLIPWKGSWGRK